MLTLATWYVMSVFCHAGIVTCMHSHPKSFKWHARSASIKGGGSKIWMKNIREIKSEIYHI